MEMHDATVKVTVLISLHYSQIFELAIFSVLAVFVFDFVKHSGELVISFYSLHVRPTSLLASIPCLTQERSCSKHLVFLQVAGASNTT
jgi:hypothetical protein